MKLYLVKLTESSFRLFSTEQKALRFIKIISRELDFEIEETHQYFDTTVFILGNDSEKSSITLSEIVVDEDADY